MKSILITAIFGVSSFFFTNSTSIETSSDLNSQTTYKLVDVITASPEQVSEFPLGYIAYWADENGNIVKSASLDKQP